MRFSTAVMILAILGLLPMRADSEAGDFQRAIDHDRAFQKEMDDQRARTDAINQPSTFRSPPSQAITAEAWLNALSEQKKRAAAANAAQARDYDLRALRAEEKRREEDRERKAEATRQQKIFTDLAVSAQPFLARGIDPTEAADMARYLTPYQTSYFDADSTEYVRETIGRAAEAKTEFDRTFDQGSYAALETLANQMWFGVNFPGGITFGPHARKLICLPLSSLRARARLQEKFRSDRSVQELAAACERFNRAGILSMFPDEQQREIFNLSLRSALLAGRGERELVGRIKNPSAKSFEREAAPEIPRLLTSSYQRAVVRLTAETSDQNVRLDVANAALADITEQIAYWTELQNWAQVLEWQVRMFELPGISVTVQGQAAFRALLTERPELVAQLKPEQWERLAGAAQLAIPELLAELPQHLDLSRQPNLVRNVRILQAAHREDRTAALALAYECRRAVDGVIEDPTGLFRALAVARATLSPASSPAAILAAAQARALALFLTGKYANRELLSEVAADAANGVRESCYVTARVQLRTNPTAEKRAEIQATLTRLGSAPLWSSQVYAPSVQNILGFSWSEDGSQPDGLTRALAIWREAARASDVTCMGALGITLSNAGTKSEQWVEARAWLDQAAALGEPTASARKGILLARGSCGYATDWGRAVPLLLRGCAVNRDGAPYYLGLAYAHGRGVARNSAEALRFWQSVEGSFHEKAVIEMADVYVRGGDIKEDKARAVSLVKPLAEQGLTEAQNSYGTLILRGYAVGVPPAECFTWWRKAAAQGYFLAARNIFATQVRGVVDAADRAGALREMEAYLERVSADQQFQGAHLILHEGPATFKENTRDEARGLAWMQRAAAAGNSSAKSWLKENASKPAL